MDKRGIRSKLLEALAEKSHELTGQMAWGWATFIKRDIYIAASPDNFVRGKKCPKKPFYKIGEKYAAWETYPTLRFKFIGEVICKKAWWEESIDYEIGETIGFIARAEFQKDNGDIISAYHFFTTIETKEMVDEFINDYLEMTIKVPGIKWSDEKGKLWTKKKT